jgi:DNA-directed RNA polymerase specialized sigma24 family protein
MAEASGSRCGGAACPSLDQLSDAELVEALLKEECAGPLWQLVRIRLAAYAVPVLHRMFLDGTIVEQTGKLGRPVVPTSEEWHDLTSGPDDRSDLIHEAVCRALEIFRDRAVLGRRWDPQRQTKLTTYFVNSCLLVLPNVVRAWRNRRKATCHTVPLGLDWSEIAGTEPGTTGDPVDDLVRAEEIEDEIARMPEKLAKAARMWMRTEQSWAEIARALGISARALEGLMHRYRTNHQRRTEDDQ